MSAFVCSPEHFKALAIFAASRIHGRWRVDPRYIKGLSHPSPVGIENLTREALATLYADTLYRENVRSVEHRYPNSARDDLPGPVADVGHVDISSRDLMKTGLALKPVQLLKLCACVAYQSCETDDWESTVAFALLQSIKDAAIRALPGYEDAAWDFSTETA